MKEKNKGKTCKECGNQAVVKGYCRKHYAIARDSGVIKIKKQGKNQVCGVGTNDMPKGWAKHNVRLYKVWFSMLERCYTEFGLNRDPSYHDCSVWERWYTLSNFVEDVKYIDGYDLWLNITDGSVHLDKDIKIEGNKTYSLATCKFVINSDNTREGQIRNGRSQAVVGVSEDGDIIEYETEKLAEKDGFIQSSISECCRGKKKIHRGYKWYFKNDYELINPSII